MSNKRFVLNGSKIVDQAIAEGRVASLRQAAIKGKISYPTAHGWNKPQDTDSPVKISLEALAGFLIDGLGFDADEIAEMKFGDLFTLIEVETEPTKGKGDGK